VNELLYLFGLIGLLYALYGVLIGFCGLLRRSTPAQARTHRNFAVLIPAHNEARVIFPLLESLNAQRYPHAHYTVVVAADHCGDDTAAIARAAGAQVLERTSDGPRGKTWTIRWALEHIDLTQFDAVSIVDADNLVHPEYLARMNNHLEAYPEAQAVQGSLDVKNPDDNWLTRAIAVSYWFTNRFSQYARSKLGLNCALGGTGMTIRVDALKRHVGQLYSLVDDLELTMGLILEGSRVQWNEFAVIYDEKPLTLAASLKQRRRWMQGHFWVLARYAPRLFGAFLRTGQVRLLDAWMMLIGPALAVIGLLTFLGSVATLAINASLETWATTAATWAGVTVVVAAVHAVIGRSAQAGRFKLDFVRALPGYVFFGLTWYWAIIPGLFKAHDQGHWVKTEHTRAVASHELEG
jgi:cellulose synthase/poly-beta-1,6-N-acetylglucosamine synthase-like glycosyltransferase